MPPSEDVDQWIADARNAGGPVIFGGVLLLVAVLGLPVWAAGLLVLIPMMAAQTVAARRVIPMPEEDWPHG